MAVLRSRALAAIGSGLLLWLSFPPIDLRWLAPFGVALQLVALRPQAGRGLGWRNALGLQALVGLAFLGPLLSWISVAGVDAWLALGVYQAVVFALTGPITAWSLTLRGWQLWASASWVLQEALRSRWPFGGFPWGRLAFSQAGTPYARLASLGGAPLVTFAVALTGATLLGANRWWRVGRNLPQRRKAGAPVTLRGRSPSRLRRLAALLAAAAIPALCALVPLPAATGGPSAVVAVVQGNVPRLGFAAFAQARAVTRNHTARTEELAAAVAAGKLPSPDLVVWPENSADLDPFHDPVEADLLTSAARAVGQPILVGAVLDGTTPTTVRNAGLIWNPDGTAGAIYVKRHPVPFGEYLPYRSILTKLVGRFSKIPYDFEKGRAPGLLVVHRIPVADVICFEVAYDSIVRDAVSAGGQVLVVQTNDATFGRSGETHQQLAMARIRAVEHGRAVLVAATSGVSAVITPDGRIARESPVFRPALLVERVPLRTSRTVADQVGGIPEAVLCVLLLLSLSATGISRRLGRPKGKDLSA